MRYRRISLTLLCLPLLLIISSTGCQKARSASSSLSLASQLAADLKAELIANGMSDSDATTVSNAGAKSGNATSAASARAVSLQSASDTLPEVAAAVTDGAVGALAQVASDDATKETDLGLIGAGMAGAVQTNAAKLSVTDDILQTTFQDVTAQAVVAAADKAGFSSSDAAATATAKFPEQALTALAGKGVSADVVTNIVPAITAGTAKALANLPTDADPAAFIQNAMTGALSGVSAFGSKLDAPTTANLIQTATASCVAKINPSSLHGADASTVVAAVAQAPVKASSSFTGFSDDEKNSLMKSGTMGVTAAIPSMPNVAPTDIGTIASSATKKAIEALGNVVSAGSMSNAVAAISAGPVLALGNIQTLTDEQKQVFVSKAVGGVTQGISTLNLTADQFKQVGPAAANAAISALGSASVSSNSLADYAQKIAQAPMENLGSFTNKLSTSDRAALAQGFAQGSTGALANFNVSSTALTNITTAVNTGAMQGLGSSVSNSDRATFLTAVGAGTAAAMGQFSKLDESQKKELFGAAAKGQVSAIAGFHGIDASAASSLAAAVNGGFVQGMTGAGVSSSSANDFLTSLGNGTAAALGSFNTFSDAEKATMAANMAQAAVVAVSNSYAGLGNDGLAGAAAALNQGMVAKLTTAGVSSDYTSNFAQSLMQKTQDGLVAAGMDANSAASYGTVLATSVSTGLSTAGTSVSFDPNQLVQGYTPACTGSCATTFSSTILNVAFMPADYSGNKGYFVGLHLSGVNTVESGSGSLTVLCMGVERSTTLTLSHTSFDGPLALSDEFKSACPEGSRLKFIGTYTLGDATYTTQQGPLGEATIPSASTAGATPPPSGSTTNNGLYCAGTTYGPNGALSHVELMCHLPGIYSNIPAGTLTLTLTSDTKNVVTVTGDQTSLALSALIELPTSVTSAVDHVFTITGSFVTGEGVTYSLPSSPALMFKVTAPPSLPPQGGTTTGTSTGGTTTGTTTGETSLPPSPGGDGGMTTTGTTAGTATGTTSGVSFGQADAAMIVAVFGQSCTSCHGLMGANRSSYDMTSNSGLMAKVVAGNPDASPLYQRINATGDAQMPPLFALNIQVKDAIRRWILSGAPALLPNDTPPSSPPSGSH